MGTRRTGGRALRRLRQLVGQLLVELEAAELVRRLGAGLEPQHEVAAGAGERLGEQGDGLGAGDGAGGDEVEAVAEVLAQRGRL